MRQHPIGTGPVQIRRVQAQRVHQGDAQPGLLEAGPALSRRHRIHHHQEPVDGDVGLHRRQVRHDVSLQRDDPADEGHQEPDAAGDLRDRRRAASTATCSSTATSRPSTTPICGGRWRWPSTARRSSTSSPKARATSAAVLQPPPDGLWGMPPDMLKELAGL